MRSNILASRSIWIAFITATLLSVVLAFLDGYNFFRGWIAYFSLLILGLLIFFWTRQTVSAGKKVARLALLSALVRLLIGIGLILLLPIYGYKDSVEHRAGYIFHDSFVRDQQAWELASSDETLGTAFSGEFISDQYGGSLALFAGIYRYLSPDAHRQALPLIVNAVVASLGVLLLWGSAKIWFGGNVAWLSGLIFAFYPEAVLLGSSQMREPIVITGVAMSIYSLANIRSRSYTWIGWLIASGIILFTFQPPIALYAFMILSVTWLLSPTREKSWILLTIFTAILVLALFLVISVWTNLPSLQEAGPLGIITTWLQNNFQFQSYVTERASGMVQKLFDAVGEGWTWLVILVYGTAQPVLPAVFGDPDAAWIIRIITFFRAAGWYALVPMLLYAVIASTRARDEPRRIQLIWVNVAIWVWIIISALSAGGDQWDNPRYRTILIAWQALVAAWALWWSRINQDLWLRRVITVEIIFISMFTAWYIGRYYFSLLHFDIWIMIGLTLFLGALVLGGGFLWDRIKE